MKAQREYYNLKVEFNKTGESIIVIAEHIGLNRVLLYNRLNGRNAWKLDEMILAQAYLKEKTGRKKSLDYLFKYKKVYKNS